MGIHNFSDVAEVAALEAVIGRRRDVRAEFSGEKIPRADLMRILEAGHRAPSVGHSQPWDFIIVDEPHDLETFAAHVGECREEFARALGEERRQAFNPIKIEGIRESGTGVVVTYSPERGGPVVLGRHTLDVMGEMSVACAIENMWLMATAMGYGMGWVSFFEEEYLREFIGAPEDTRVLAWLCVGPVKELQSVPDLVRFGWEKGRSIESAVHWGRYSQ
ncbi:MAG: 5,6-dimethylbenzimidazole synthase [Corynebacterium sp.]|nr:5,6-dimethylbenzimidazole synthase [Corynebacterium sp.]